MKRITIILALVCLVPLVCADVQLPLTVVWNPVVTSFYSGTLCLEETNLFGTFDDIAVGYSLGSPPSPKIIYLIDQGSNKYCNNLTPTLWDSSVPDTLANALIKVKYGADIIFQDDKWSTNVSVTINDSNHLFHLMQIICLDNDGDGYNATSVTCPASNDCDDNNFSINPGATEVCDGIDNDCDTNIDGGGDDLCDDNLWCNGDETCNASMGCQDGIPMDCSGNDSTPIETCFNDPDNNPFTWDYFAGFISVCDEVNDKCTNGTVNLTHTCIANCSAECENNNDCPLTECDYLDGCVGKDYHDYSDVNSICGNCSCENNICNVSVIYQNATRCVNEDNDTAYDIFDCNDYNPSIGECPGCKLCTENASLLTSNGTCVIATNATYNYEYCPIPIYDKFSPSLTTNFSNVSLFNANVTLGIAGSAALNFVPPIDMFKFINNTYYPLDLNAYIDFQPRIISLDSINLYELNLSANLTFFNLAFTNYYILKDGTTTQNYTTIQSPNAANSYTLIIGIEHFTTYEVRQVSSPQPPRKDTGGSSSGGGGGIFIPKKEQANETKKENKTKATEVQIPEINESEETEQQEDIPTEEAPGAKITGAVVADSGGANIIVGIVVMVAISGISSLYYFKRRQRLKEEAIIEQLKRKEK